MNEKSAVLAGSFGDVTWLRVVGRGTYQTSAGLKKFCRETVAKGRKKIVVDLGECELMDSTFMGAITGIALGLRDESGKSTIELVNVNERNAGLLHNLGLDQLFTVRKCGDPSAPRRPDAAGMERLAQPENGPGTAHILQAHRDLVAADSENEARFRDVLELLEKEEQKS